MPAQLVPSGWESLVVLVRTFVMTASGTTSFLIIYFCQAFVLMTLHAAVAFELCSLCAWKFSTSQQGKGTC